MQAVKLTAAAAMVVSMLASCGGTVDATIGGTVTGLVAGGVVILTNTVNNDSVSVAFSSSGNPSFTFDQTVPQDGSYNVIVSTPPAGQSCEVTNGNGTIANGVGNIDVNNIQVACKASTNTTVPVIISLAGLSAGVQVTLLNNGSDTLTMTGTTGTAAGQAITQYFPTPLAGNAPYNVTFKAQPTNGQTCTFSGNQFGTVTVSGGSPVSPVIGVMCAF